MVCIAFLQKKNGHVGILKKTCIFQPCYDTVSPSCHHMSIEHNRDKEIQTVYYIAMFSCHNLKVNKSFVLSSNQCVAPCQSHFLLLIGDLSLFFYYFYFPAIFY